MVGRISSPSGPGATRESPLLGRTGELEQIAYARVDHLCA